MANNKTPTDQTLRDIDSYHRNGVFYFRKYAELPRVCLFSGDDVSPHELPYIYTHNGVHPFMTTLYFIVRLAFGLLAVLVSFFSKDRTTSTVLKFYLSPNTKLKIKKRKRIFIYLLISIFVMLFLIVWCEDTPYDAFTGPLFLGSIIATIIWHFRFNRPFRKLRLKKGFFSLKGAHPKFLKALTQLPSITSSSAQPKIIEMREKKGTRDFRPPK